MLYMIIERYIIDLNNNNRARCVTRSIYTNDRVNSSNKLRPAWITVDPREELLVFFFFSSTY